MEGKDFHLSLVKQLSGEIIEELSKERSRMVIFTDVGSGFLNDIQEKLCGNGKTVIILDHHEKQGDIKERYKGSIFHINPLDFGIEDNISGSGVTYLFARTLNPENRDLSVFAIIGAIGDSQTGSIGEKWGLMGLNKEILKDAQKTGKIKVTKGLRLWGRNTRPIHKALEYSVDPYIPGISGSESASVQFLQEIGIELKNGKDWRTLSELNEEEVKKLASAIIAERTMNGESNPEWIFGDVYELPKRGVEFSDANEFATMLNACGKMDRAFDGVGLCLSGKCYEEGVLETLSRYRREIGRALSWIEKHKEIITETENAVYINAGNKISEHIISNVVSIMNKSGMLPDKPVFAFAETQDGKIKVSARASEGVVEKGVDMKDVTAKVVEKTGGEGGGHAGASGATIPKEALDTFIKESDMIIKSILDSDDTGTANSNEAGSEKGLSEKKIGFEARGIAEADEHKNNLNPMEQQEIKPDGSLIEKESVEHGSAESERSGEGREEKGSGKAEGRENGKEAQDSEEVEGQGLVRYFLS